MKVFCIILLSFQFFFVTLHPKSAIKREQSDACINFVEREQTRQSQASRAVPERVTRQPSFSLATVASTMRKILFTSKTKSYATAHLLHQVCPAVRRHADSRVSNSFQRTGAKPRLVLYACLPRSSTHRRVPPPWHRCFCR